MRPAIVLERHAVLAIRVLLIGLLATGAVYAFHALAPIVLPLLFALLLTALLSPVVDLIAGHMRRGFAVALVILGFLLFIFGTLAYVVPALVTQAADAVQQVEGGLDKLPEVAGDIGLDARETQDLFETLSQRLRDNLGGISSAVSTGAITIASATISAGIGAFLTFVLLVYLLIDGRAFWNGAVRLLDADRRAGVQAGAMRAWRALVVFVRSQVVVAAIDAIGIALGLFIFGVPLVLPLGVLTFILSFIPYLGATLSGLIVALVALSTQGFGAMVGVLGVAIAVQMLEGHLVYPVLVGRNLRLHPITVLLAVGVGSSVLGILGAFFATPVLATVAAAAGLLPDLDTDEEVSRVVQEADEVGESPPSPTAVEPPPASNLRPPAEMARMRAMPKEARAFHDEIIAHNKDWAETFQFAGLPTVPQRHMAVVVCMDSRIDVFAALGLDIGEAHVIRNAGGIVTDDVIRSLTISQRFLETRAIVVVQHTRCGMQTFKDDDLRDDLERETGHRPEWPIGAFEDLTESVRASVEKIRASPFLKHTDLVWGGIYDVETGLITEVAAPPEG